MADEYEQAVQQRDKMLERAGMLFARGNDGEATKVREEANSMAPFLLLRHRIYIDLRAIGEEDLPRATLEIGDPT